MTTGTLTMSDFLLARITEDEARVGDGIHPGGPDGLGSVLTPWEERRWLAECEAKRQIVDIHKMYTAEGATGCGLCEFDGYWGNWGMTGPCDTLRAILAIYADHPDYREEWRP